MSLPGHVGHFDNVEPVLAGWVVDTSDPGRPVAIVATIDGERRLCAVADRPRPDVAEAEAGYDPSQLSEKRVAEWIASVAYPSDGAIFIARVGERLVGYSRIERGQGGASGIGVLALTVLAACRRKGLGERLTRPLFDEVRLMLDEVWLSVEAVNLPAIRLYEKLGFV
ncbi:MAG TPA: GNAT family N-acetyltransferase [Stellaceae bacterium]|nr:GNAT family N-acetyltransferase [Stellaceae bacterium]